MSLKEDYLYWTIAKQFIIDRKYRIINMTQDQNEIWLENIRDKQIPIVRLKRIDMDWSNWLRRDIQLTGSNGNRVKKAFYKRSLEVLNVYVTGYPPVDSYQDALDTPLFIEKDNITVRSHLIVGSNLKESYQPLFELFNTNIFGNVKEEYDIYEIENLKKYVLTQALQEAKKESQLLQTGKPLFSYVFLALQIIVFLLMELRGGSQNPFVLIEFGAKFNPFIIEGEWWRLFTPMFLHIGLLHLLMNSLALYYLGPTVEKIYGRTRFLFIYLFAGFLGSLASFIFSPNLAAGASGAIFGCFGALLFFGIIHPQTFFRTMGMNVILLLVFNLALGFLVTSIDNAGHIGGLIGGFLASGIVHLPKKKKPLQQLGILAGTILLTLIAIYFGFTYPNI